jgi:hypothetical protein
MATGKVLYAIRMPLDLKRLLDEAAASGGLNTSQLVIHACWKYLERGAVAHPAEQRAHNPTVAGSSPAGPIMAEEEVPSIGVASSLGRPGMNPRCPVHRLPLVRNAETGIWNCRVTRCRHRPDDEAVKLAYETADFSSI